MKNLMIIIFLFASGFAMAAATDPCRTYNVSRAPTGGCSAHPEAMYCRVRCENGGNYRPSAILDIPDGELPRECKNKLLRDFALAMSQSPRNTNAILRKKFKSFLAENSCVFSEGTTGGAVDDLSAMARSFLSAYWEEAACIDVAAECRANTVRVGSGSGTQEVHGIYREVDGKKYCQLGDLMLDPSCLINNTNAMELAQAAQTARERINSCLGGATTGTGIKTAMERMFTKPLASRPKHCCGACLQASVGCGTDDAAVGNLCAFNCGTNSASVVTYGTHLLGHFSDPPPGFMEGGSCARTGNLIDQHESLASTIFHEYLHAIGVCTDKMHNESGRSPFDPVYGCEKFCFQSAQPKNCIACAMASTGTMQVSSMGSGGALSTTSSSSPNPDDVTRRGNITYESWVNFLYGTTTTQPVPTLPQACVASLNSFIQSKAEGEVSTAIGLLHSCIPDIISDEPETDLRVVPPPGGYAVWARVYNLRQAGNKCNCDPADATCRSSGIRDPLTHQEGPKMNAANAFARACTQATLPSGSVERSCCREQKRILERVTWAAERNRRGCLMHALNTARGSSGSAMTCYTAAKRECETNPPHPGWRGRTFDQLGQEYCRDIALNVCHIGDTGISPRYTFNIDLGTNAAGLDALGRETERVFNECMTSHLPASSSPNFCNVADLPASVCDSRPVTSFYDRVNRPENTTWGVENALAKTKCQNMATGRLQSNQDFPPGMPSF